MVLWGVGVVGWRGRCMRAGMVVVRGAVSVAVLAGMLCARVTVGLVDAGVAAVALWCLLRVVARAGVVAARPLGGCAPLLSLIVATVATSTMCLLVSRG